MFVSQFVFTLFSPSMSVDRYATWPYVLVLIVCLLVLSVFPPFLIVLSISAIVLLSITLALFVFWPSVFHQHFFGINLYDRVFPMDVLERSTT